MALAGSGSSLVFQQDAKHEITDCKVKGHDDLAANSSDDGIHLHPVRNVVFSDTGLETIEGPTLLELRRHIIFGMAAARLELDNAGHVQRGHRKIAQTEMPVEGRLGDRQVLCLDDVIQMLSLVDTFSYDAVIFVKGLLGQRDSGTALDERFPVSLMSELGQVFMFSSLQFRLRWHPLQINGAFSRSGQGLGFSVRAGMTCMCFLTSLDTVVGSLPIRLAMPLNETPWNRQSCISIRSSNVRCLHVVDSFKSGIRSSSFVFFPDLILHLLCFPDLLPPPRPLWTLLWEFANRLFREIII